MRLAVRVKTGARRDGVWREGDGLYVQIRAIAEHDSANDYLVKYLSGCLRVAQALITLTQGRHSSHKVVEVKIRDSDLLPMLNTLGTVPAAQLFDDV